MHYLLFGVLIFGFIVKYNQTKSRSRGIEESISKYGNVQYIPEMENLKFYRMYNNSYKDTERLINNIEEYNHKNYFYNKIRLKGIKSTEELNFNKRYNIVVKINKEDKSVQKIWILEK